MWPYRHELGPLLTPVGFGWRIPRSLIPPAPPLRRQLLIDNLHFEDLPTSERRACLEHSSGVCACVCVCQTLRTLVQIFFSMWRLRATGANLRSQLGHGRRSGGGPVCACVCARVCECVCVCVCTLCVCAYMCV